MPEPDTQPHILDAARRVVESTYEEQSGQPDLRTAPDREAVDDLEHVLSAYEWAGEPPEEPGWYWMRIAKEYTEIVHVRQTADTLFCGGKILTKWLETKDHIIEWAGPIPEPTDTDRS